MERIQGCGISPNIEETPVFFSMKLAQSVQPPAHRSPQQENINSLLQVLNRLFCFRNKKKYAYVQARSTTMLASLYSVYLFYKNKLKN